MTNSVTRCGEGRDRGWWYRDGEGERRSRLGLELVLEVWGGGRAIVVVTTNCVDYHDVDCHKGMN